MSLESKLSVGQPLPPNPYEQGSDTYEAYERCLQLERRPAWNAFLDDVPQDHPYEDIVQIMTTIVTAGVLGHGLYFAPNDTGRNALDAAQNPHLLEASSSNAAQLRSLTLLRDHHRCVFTGKVDRRSLQRGIVGPSPEATSTNVAHIISQSLTDGIHGVTPAHQAKFERARTAGAMIERFGGFDARNVLNQDNIHSPKNAFTASIDPHEMFDQL
ncbi:hypothetical protein GY45DRAFT_1420463 [Cubamyces sp. BRFM 1775]|nr:hypothetical protein GY45DRAFT_1420463 [Cubamyces sp. BRFM 1775]